MSKKAAVLFDGRECCFLLDTRNGRASYSRRSTTDKEGSRVEGLARNQGEAGWITCNYGE